MEFWEFLIQKEGDRSWLPLESPSVEILEGRYRVVARSNRTNTATEIRVTHYATNETPPVRRVRKRSNQTNADGLIVILPFTRLQPGLWELHCTGDLMAEMMGESWQHVVQLDVVPQTQVDDWEPEPQDSEENLTAAEAVTDPAIVAETGSVEELTATNDSALLSAPTDEVTNPAEAGNLTEAANPAIALTDQTEQQVAHDSHDFTGSDEALSSEAATNSPLESTSHADGDTSETPISGISVEATAPAEMSEMLQQVEQRSEQMVDSLFRDLADFDTESLGTVAESNLAANGSETQTPQLQVILERETYIMQRSEPLVLTGRIEFSADQSPDSPSFDQVSISELRVRLFDPQTSQLLMDEGYPIDDRVPPFPFSGQISLPQHYQTYLVLGELVFHGKSAGAPQILARRSFNVTTDLHELIESIANDFPDVDALPPEAQVPEIAEPLPPAELDRLSQIAFQRSPQQPLPPQLRPTSPTRTHASLELPSFMVSRPQEAAVTPSAPEPEPTTSEANADIEDALTAASEIPQDGVATQAELAQQSMSTTAADLLAPSELSISLPEVSIPSLQNIADTNSDITPAVRTASQLQAASPDRLADTTIPDLTEQAVTAPGATDDASDLFLNWDELHSQVPIWQQRQPRPVELSNSPEDVSFRALNLQSRFWTRLQALATNPDLSATLGTAGGARANAETLTPPSSETAIRKRQAVGFDAELTAQEVVVDDDYPLIQASELPHDAETLEVTDVPENSGPILPEDEPIPMPRLQLPSGEITAGQPISITVKMPSLMARVYVKLWLRDRQTRTLLGTPRWLIDFVPDGFGNQMTRTEVVVPPGCLKVQFEAIAVEIATQRESDKAMMTRPVVPPDLSPLSLDGLEI